MAEKGFGVKEINLIGPSGTPTIESPNNLNLNAVNVAISTNVSIGGTLTVSGNVSVGGTLTYEDVTNIDSVGLITARSGVTVSSGNVTTPSINLTNNGLNLTSSHNIGVSADGLYVNNTSNNSTIASFQFSTGCQLRDTNGVVRLYTQTTGATVTGTLAATTFSGSGASLTNLPLPDVQVAYTVTANGTSAYRFAGNGVVSTANNPDLYLIRGQKYRFINNSGGSHPFQIRVSDGGSAYSTGVTNNGAASGNIDFAPTFDSPAQLVYQCTSHGGMVGNIYLRDAAGNNTNVGVTTFSQTTSSVAGVTVTSQGLHHYEEGTFTPFISASSSAPSVSYGAERGGKYTRIGDVVFYSLGMNLASYSGGSGNVYIGGFPYVGSGDPGWDGAHVFRDCSAIGLNSRTNQLGGWMETVTLSLIHI